MHIEVQVLDGCPSADETYDLVVQQAHLVAPGTRVELVRLDEERALESPGFYGSPTIRIDGVDLEARQGPPAGVTGRIYPSSGGVPPTWLVQAGLLRALAPATILFLCVANSARSQMAEGVARSLAPAGVRILSAGSQPSLVRSEALAVLAEIGVDASGQRSKGFDDIDLDSVEAVVTLCSDEVCPFFPRPVPQLHWALPDPAAVEGEGRLEAFRQVREELRRRLAVLFAG